MPTAPPVRMGGVTAPPDPRSDFAAAQQAREAAWLSALATPSYPGAAASAPEPDCGLRTPFQRDRDRIVHCKAFRRLKHKTQVFVAPEGDHYRTRLTHTLEVTGISRTVARALRLNEDLTEAIGLGHDVGHPPFGHIGEDVLDRAGPRALRPRLPPQRALAAGRRPCSRASTSPSRCATASCATPAARASPPRSRARSCGWWTGSPTSTTTSTTRVRAGRARARGPAGRGDRDPRPDRLGAHRHARPRPRRALRGAPGTSSRARPSAARCSRCARSCSSASTSARGRARSTRRSSACCAGCSTGTASTRTSCPTGRRVRGRPRDRLPGRHDRPLRDPGLDRALRPAGPRALMARYTDESASASATRSTSPSIVGARTELKRAGVQRLAGACARSRERRRRSGCCDFEELVGARTELKRAGSGGCRGCARSTTSARRRSASTRSRRSTTASAAARAATSSGS